MKDKLCGMLGLARRAGRTAGGTETVRDAIRRGNCVLALLARDASDNVRKRISNCCTHYGVKLLEVPLTAAELGYAVGHAETSTLGVTDASFAGAIEKILGEKPEGSL